MLSASDRPHSPAAIRIDLGAIFVSMELSNSTWLMTSLSPGAGERMSKHVVRAGDVAGLMGRFSLLREKSRARTGQDFGFIVIQEAGLDGFWIHRILEREGIESYVVDPASTRRRVDAGARRLTRSTAKHWFAPCSRTNEVSRASVRWSEHPVPTKRIDGASVASGRS